MAQGRLFFFSQVKAMAALLQLDLSILYLKVCFLQLKLRLAYY